MLVLYDYCRSSAAFRVRIALNLKAVVHEQISVHLLKEGGQQLQKAYRDINPQGLVPTLVDSDNQLFLNQSLAIIEYLEECHPMPPLLPHDKIQKAKVRAFSQMIACDIHPLNNLRVLKYLKHELSVTDEQKKDWYHHWLKEGFQAIEQYLRNENKGNVFCFGQTPSMADICLVPQVYNAIRFEFSLESYPLIQKIYAHCVQQPAFSKALPEKQSDY